MLKLGHKMQTVYLMEIITVTDHFTGLIVCLFFFPSRKQYLFATVEISV